MTSSTLSWPSTRNLQVAVPEQEPPDLNGLATSRRIRTLGLPIQTLILAFPWVTGTEAYLLRALQALAS